MEPLKQWICDVCDEEIDQPTEGYVIWKYDDKRRMCDIKIIHQGRCDQPQHPASMSLDRFLGIDGLNYLLAMIDIGPIKHRLGENSGQNFSDNEEFVDFIRRVQIPYYEEARRYFNEPTVLHLHEDGNELSPYLPESLQRIIEMCSK